MFKRSSTSGKHSHQLPDMSSHEMIIGKISPLSSNTSEVTDGDSWKLESSQESSKSRKITDGSSSSSSISASVKTNSRSTYPLQISNSWPGNTVECEGKSNIVILAQDEGFKNEGMTEGERWGSGESKVDSYYSANYDETDGIM